MSFFIDEDLMVCVDRSHDCTLYAHFIVKCVEKDPRSCLDTQVRKTHYTSSGYDINTQPHTENRYISVFLWKHTYHSGLNV